MSQVRVMHSTVTSWDEANALYLHLHLRRLRLYLTRRVLWLRRQWGHDPRRESMAQVISEAHADWLLRGAERDAEDGFYTCDPEALRLGDQIVAVEEEIDALVEGMGRKLPALEVLAHLFKLTDLERDVLLMCLAPDLDSTFPQLYAYAQDDMSRQGVTAHLALDLFGGDAAERQARYSSFGETAPLRHYGLVRPVERAGASPAAMLLTLDERIGDYMRGFNRPAEQISSFITPVRCGPLTESQRESVDELAKSLSSMRNETGEWALVSLAGIPDSGQAEVAQAVCDRLGLTLYRLDAAQLASRGDQFESLRILEREVILLQIGLYVALRDTEMMDTSSRHFLANLTMRRGLFVIVSSRDPYRNERPTLTERLERPHPASRIVLWQEALGDDANLVGDGLPLLVEQFNFGPQTIMQVVASARQHSTPLSAPALWQACRQATSSDLDEIAQRIEASSTWSDIVLTPPVMEHLREISSQVEHRAQVYNEWGFGDRLSRGRGISAMFAGPTGTGKTLAAEVLANHLDLSLYRVDMASLVSKYVGETEKNIRRVFEAAERQGVILFFDEADALFGKRTDVKDSHDRFANMEVNYLLQRMESYWGLAILATNRRNSLDRAFLRRLRFVVEFPFPDIESRRRIWRQVFPPGTPLDDVDFNRLARLEIAGGNIRNAALNAAFLAARDGSPVTMEHVMQAIRSEYAKIDKATSEADLNG